MINWSISWLVYSIIHILIDISVSWDAHSYMNGWDSEHRLSVIERYLAICIHSSCVPNINLVAVINIIITRPNSIKALSNIFSYDKYYSYL